jgi:hypothetical protein
MRTKEHRPGVKEVNIVTRHLGLSRPIDAETLNQAMVEIDRLIGLDSITFDDESDKLHFSYDASRLCIDCVEDVLTTYGIQPKQDWWTRFKEGHYRFVDQNVRENARREPWSCHRTPPHARK